MNALALFQEQREAARRIGNHASVTAAGLRIAAHSGRADNVRDYLLYEMGIGADVREEADGLIVGVRDRHSFAAIWSALRGEFRVVGAMLEDGRQAVKIYNNRGVKESLTAK